jgi:hypothetical protein
MLLLVVAYPVIRKIDGDYMLSLSCALNYLLTIQHPKIA